MRWPVVERVAGTTLKVTWRYPGVTADQITSALIDRNANCVSSLAAVNSYNGFYYCRHQLPPGAAPYVNEWRAWINSFQYVDRQLVRTFDQETD